MNINKEQYDKILNSAPQDHTTDEFVSWLRDNNKIILETPDWLVVDNIKYSTEELPWYTAFDLRPDDTLQLKYLKLQWEFPEYKMIIHPFVTRSIKRFHIHLIRADKTYQV